MDTLDYMRLPPGFTARYRGRTLMVDMAVTDIRDGPSPMRIGYTCTIHEVREWVTLRGRHVEEPEHIKNTEE